MIKITLIGNGFDLAHGAPTRYSDFMNYIFNSTAYMHEQFGMKMPIVGGVNREGNFIHFSKDKKNIDPWLGVYYDERVGDYIPAINPDKSTTSVYFKSLLKRHSRIRYWADLENHYYNTLLDNYISQENVQFLNAEFEHLKSLFGQYLIDEIEHNVGEEKSIKADRSSTIYKALFEEDLYKHHYLVSFNYTSKLLSEYCKWMQVDSTKEDYLLKNPIHIHGKLQSEERIIFGYGDDNSEEFEMLKQHGDDNLLMNFKTYEYLRNNSYNELFNILDSDEAVMIQILGLSCGTGDKTLLQAIFEHPNTKSIEFLYHGEELNYRKNIFNLSRIFTKSSDMRRKVVSYVDTRKI